MRFFWILVYLAWGASVAWAQDVHLLVVAKKVWAPDQMIKPILISLRILNQGPGRCAGATAVVTLTPQYRPSREGGYPPGGKPGDTGPTFLNPFRLEASLPAMQPGQSREIVVETPYMARGAFSSSGNLFWVENLIPNLRRTVPIRYDVTFEF